ncbi:hypothetical protein HAX54_029713 [Datura stramonium]|uniref:SURP motif domain-containing protein n=1 Tax=Datura stramonium TaxID=4076 RepID=A0ABS8RKY4_DATST|nr:hypothetical protein [Datura stramonium]
MHGRQFEHITRQKNPGDTPFKFLFDESCPDYKYYEYRLREEEKALSQASDAQTAYSGVASTATPSSTGSSHRSHQQHSDYQIPASALYGATENTSSSESAGKSVGCIRDYNMDIGLVLLGVNGISQLVCS